MTIITLECVFVHSVILFFYIVHTRAVTLGEFRRFKTSDFQTQKSLRKSIINAFPCVILCASILTLSYVKAVNFWFSLCGTLYIIKMSSILAQRCERKFAHNFNPLSGNYNATAIHKKIVASF